MVRKFSRCTEKTCKKAVGALPLVVRCVVVAILNFLDKTVGLVA